MLSTSDADWQQILKNTEINTERKRQAVEQAKKSKQRTYSWQGIDGSSGYGTTDSAFTWRDDERTVSAPFLPNNLNNTSATNTSSSNTGNGGIGSNSSNSLLSSLGLGTDSNLFDSAKDMARFRLGLDQEQAKFSRGLREDEAQSNFGRTTKLTAQQLTGQQDLESLRQNATTERTEKQLQNNLDLLNTGNNFNLLVLGKNRAAALRGLR